ARHFFLAQHGWQLFRTFGRWQIFSLIRPPQCLDEEETECAIRATMVLTAKLTVMDQVKLILPNMLLVEPIRTLAEESGKILDCMQIAFDCKLRVITTLEFFQYPFS